MIDTLETLGGLMRQDGATLIYAKKLAPNDNSKNQVYLGGDFSVLNIIPHGKVQTDDNDVAGSVRDRAKAPVDFYWIDETGKHKAPNAQLILYPKYPEVRMSGFLRGCKSSPGDIMRVRDEGRVLFIGVTKDGKVLGYAAEAGSALANAVYAQDDWEEAGVFLKIPDASNFGNTREQLLEALTGIYRKHWIPSQKIGPDGLPHPYRARNGGGYTLEAELGISPNGYSEPDYLGWEIKQYGVNDFETFTPKSVVTLMTPEPTGGIYRENGVADFLRRYGYPDKSGKPDRINFGGVYSCTRPAHAETGLKLRMVGYDATTSKITDMNGGVALLDQNDEVAALWKFTGIIDHWNRKHAQAAYVPSLFQNPPPEYRFGPRILLCEKTDLTLFLSAISNGVVYYDPGIKLEQASSANPVAKKRSQFRIRHNNLTQMYHQHEIAELELL
nr:MvaI/BcnI family restriction endonuclease [uncultured Cohaesibacter sp.]